MERKSKYASLIEEFSQEDLVIPINGIPLSVVRTYDSLNPDAADFGFSWS